MTSTIRRHDVLWSCARLDALSPMALQRIHVARQQVFVVEQACAFQDADAADEQAWHLCGRTVDGALLAYARLVDPGVKYAEPSIGRVLTTAAARGTGLGRELVARAVAQASALWPGLAVRISAQHRLERFYAEAGFQSVGAPYLEDDLPHIEMLRR
ncbi:MAG TPA: GNAT family N-acetyltransferase [Methylibium sp.]|nr:GNAT family N-acetyltransferase [Methylibium sp.]